MEERKCMTSPVAQWVKSLGLSLLWLGSLPWHGLATGTSTCHGKAKKKKGKRKYNGKVNEMKLKSVFLNIN